MKFVFDECISHRIADALAALGENASSSKEEWGQGAPDMQWIPAAGKLGWCIITSDKLRPHERLALKQNLGRVFLLATKNLSFWEQVKLVINKWEAITKTAAARKPPYIIRVPKRGNKLQPVPI